jgi:hypothetical protein
MEGRNTRRGGVVKLETYNGYGEQQVGLCATLIGD